MATRRQPPLRPVHLAALLVLCSLSGSPPGRAEDDTAGVVAGIARQLAELGRAQVAGGITGAAFGGAQQRLCSELVRVAESAPATADAAEAWYLIAADWIGRAEHPEAYGLPASQDSQFSAYRESTKCCRKCIEAGEASRPGQRPVALARIYSAHLLIAYCETRLGNLAGARQAVDEYLPKHPDDQVGVALCRKRRAELFLRDKHVTEALSDARWLCAQADARWRAEGHLLCAACFAAALPADWERSAGECRQALEISETHLPDRLPSLRRFAASRESKAEKAPPRERTAGVITVLRDIDRSFQYLSKARQQEGRAAWEERVQQLTAHGTPQRDTHDAITLEPEGPDPQQTDTARTTAAVSVKPVDGPATAGALRCTFVREERIWRLQDLELVTQERR
ncbi:MAG: hypothetical protein COY42_32190 [Armatimonadetes bacterium CG_4_10_14_0_8_um_filter_66_14]|nr:MAG: hypothetical protein COZ57_19435 [Armatimonadetes bacterium CG_4_8_14_3_um_filter_66_20]PIZ31739.1 MAG: hypothetical protein COY42_32190 [Armatimonadetes bacterium CG_4_10_14_0_8_um_filter_66_14]PJB60348.1 MAG: hypothetical protein CO096_34400 [Armatimonadetes bacterium CG_4_9_14_3_um_filter_66_14]